MTFRFYCKSFAFFKHFLVSFPIKCKTYNAFINGYLCFESDKIFSIRACTYGVLYLFANFIDNK